MIFVGEASENTNIYYFKCSAKYTDDAGLNHTLSLEVVPSVVGIMLTLCLNPFNGYSCNKVHMHA